MPGELIYEARDQTVGPLLGEPGTSWSVEARLVRDAVLASGYVLDLRHLEPPTRVRDQPSSDESIQPGVEQPEPVTQPPASTPHDHDPDPLEGVDLVEALAPFVPDLPDAALTTQHRTRDSGDPLAVLDLVLAGDDALADLQGSVAASTWRSYRSDLRDYADFCNANNRDWSKPATISAYLCAIADAGAAYATIERRQTAIAKLHEARQVLLAVDVDDPTKHPKVRTELKRLRASSAPTRTERPR